MFAALLFASISVPAHAQPISNCRITSSAWNIVSLGFPLRTERLAYIPHPKVLVLPYQLKGAPKYTLSDNDKSVFIQAGKKISELSYNKSTINFVFNPTLELSTTAQELDVIKKNVQSSWQKDFSKSTYGFVEKALKEGDTTIDYTGIDAVVLFGASKSSSQSIGEAMMFTKDTTLATKIMKTSGGNWFDPLQTADGEITNAVLLFNMLDTSTVTHELMHLYGLTDLYGAASSPPLSLMSTSDAYSILPYEQWVLGWLPDSNVICVDPISELTQNLASNRFVLDYSKGDQSLVIPKSSTTALIIDVVNYRQTPYLLFYSLNNDARPPIVNFLRKASFQQSLDLDLRAGINSEFDSPDYRVLVTDNDGSRVALNIVPISTVGSVDYQQLKNQAESNRRESEKLIKAKQEADAKAANDKWLAEQKANEEAEAKVVAELQAKQEAEAKAAAELKAKQDAAAAKVAALKKTTITCVKGKLTRKVTAIKPVCPDGYKKK